MYEQDAQVLTEQRQFIEMLDTTLSGTFVPGTNIKRYGIGANWMFLLPSLDLKRILCFGMPTIPTLVALCNVACEVVVICSSRRSIEKARTIKQRHELSSLRLAIVDENEQLPLRTDSIDLALFVDQRCVRRMCQNASWSAELHRALHSQGVIYFEPGYMGRWFLGSKTIANFNGSRPAQGLFWLMPIGGEVSAAVPSHDRAALTYLLERGLCGPRTGSFTFRGVRDLVKRRRFGRAHVVSGGQGMAHDPSRRSSSIPSGARSVSKAVLRTFGRAETLLLQKSSFLRRHGMLIDMARRGGPPSPPPRYLCTIAQEAGIDISSCAWGLSARGEYASRKVLIFLFDRFSEGQRPSYVVKMVRDPIYNARLENEQRGLLLLRDKAIQHGEALPQVAFSGYHSGRMILGETAIHGRAFREQTTATAYCPHFHAAVDWLTQLGAATADPAAARSEQVARRLGVLFNRFAQIYDVSPRERAFLNGQIATIARNQDRFPVVFQHGDPGPWNVLITPTGRVAFLDWEANEPTGMPLWDLFYFMASYCVGAARALRIHDSLKGFAHQFLGDSPVSRMVVESVARYCQQTALSAELVQPLFYTCWMHRALKESTRRASDELERGHYMRLLRLCIERRDAPTLTRLFA